MSDSPTVTPLMVTGGCRSGASSLEPQGCGAIGAEGDDGAEVARRERETSGPVNGERADRDGVAVREVDGGEEAAALPGSFRGKP